jgi:hypothetical protein
MDRLQVTIKPNRLATRLLVTLGQDDVLKAMLPPPTHVHPQAAATLLEAISLWFTRPLYAVLVADAQGTSCELGLCDGFGTGRKTSRFEVEVYDPAHRHRPLGSFVDLRQLALRGLP